MLNNELHTLQALAEHFDGEPAATGSYAADPKMVRSQISAKCFRIKAAFTAALFSTAQDQAIERYIRHHQYCIADLADRLDALQGCPAPAKIQEALPYFVEQLSELLLYTRKFFCKYFDTNTRVPKALYGIIFSELSHVAVEVQAATDARLKSAALRACVSGYLQHMGKAPPGLSYRDLDYFKLFLSELSVVFAEATGDDADQEVCVRLIQLNFNHLNFFLYRQEAILHELGQAAAQCDALRLLQQHLVAIKGTPSRQAPGYDPAWPGLKTMLGDWLQEELAGRAALAERGTAIADLPETAGKLSFNHSVAQIACLIHTLYDENCFGSATVTDVLRFAVHHFRSKRQQQISLGSLSKEYYSVTQVNAAVIRDLCQRMTARINKHYFPVLAVICAACYAAAKGW